MADKWFRSGYLQHAPAGAVNREQGIIEGVSVCTAGEAKGHGVHLDAEFIESVVAQGQALKQGLKARFGHPSMCSTALGTFIGRFKNFRMEGEQAFADLFLSNDAKETPNGNLHDYVLSLAENNPDMFGTSIVFTPGRTFRRDADGSKVITGGEPAEGESEELFVEMEALHACDAVDEPAANDGLFSGETVAGQVSMFLADYPLVLDQLAASPEILDAIAEHGSQVKEFITRFQEHDLARQTITKPNDEKESDVTHEETEEKDLPVEDGTTETPEESATESETPEAAEPAEVEETADDSEQDEGTEETEETESELNALQRAVQEFGAEIATEAFGNGGGYDEAKDLYLNALREENELLKKKDSAYSKGEEPLDHSAEPEARKGWFKTA